MDGLTARRGVAPVIEHSRSVPASAADEDGKPTQARGRVSQSHERSSATDAAQALAEDDLRASSRCRPRDDRFRGKGGSTRVGRAARKSSFHGKSGRSAETCELDEKRSSLGRPS
jgi:hypothetical protein